MPQNKGQQLTPQADGTSDRTVSALGALSTVDVAVACGHVNSYPRPSRGGRRPYDLALPELGLGFLDTLGIERVAADEVTLRPSLLPHVGVR